ncbi:Ig-like domain-containing protein [Corallococcus sp. AS-1-12]|uniref:Ig-like domain-containing protein n=1 Tax=Corallococcus sp. AS-1-12 TaxID=2874598 RepID=UPI001CC1691B|nr:Ig-like domain-containing protein [Corallococcus sp. AS-1-12]MBZ4336094.1 hypothetical protein [Corallococcus sp. AS-1-12]
MQRCFGVLVCAALLVACGGPGSDPAKTSARIEVERQIAQRGFDLRDTAVVPMKDGDDTYHRLHVQGVPVWGLGAKTANGQTRFTDIRFEPAEKVETRARITRAAAEAAALAELSDPTAAIVRDAELVLRPREELRLRPDAPARAKPNAEDYERVITELTPIFRLTLSTGGPGSRWPTPERWIAQVDARSGQVRLAPMRLDLTYGKATLKGYYSGTAISSVVTAKDIRQWELQDMRGNRYFATRRNADKSYTFLPYTSADAYFGDGAQYVIGWPILSANGETAAVDAFAAVNMTSTMFEYFLGRTGTKALPAMRVNLHYPWNNASYNPDDTTPSLDIGYRIYPAEPGMTTLQPLAVTDVMAHELAHDFFGREVYGNPELLVYERSEEGGLNEGTADIIGFFTELGRDTMKVRPLNEIDQTPLRQASLTMGEDTGFPGRNILTPIFTEWSPTLGEEDPHYAGGPLTRMYLLLAYGCQPLAQGQPPGPWQCPLVPQGFTGIGPSMAAVLWTRAVEMLSPGASYAQARTAMLSAAETADGAFGGTKLRAVASAFGAINVGTAPDTNPPQVSLTCKQAGPDISCIGNITDAEVPYQWRTPSRLSLDGGAQTIVLGGWNFNRSFSGAGLSAGSHTVTLTAWDYWNNSASQTVTVTLDRTPPTASLSVSGPPKQPLFTITANDSAGIGGIDIYDGTEFRTHFGPSYPPPYEQTYDITTWTEGTHPMIFKVYDGFGNVTTLTHALVVDHSPPSVTLGTSQVGVVVTLNVNISDPCGLTYPYGLYVDGLLVASPAGPSSVLTFGDEMAQGVHAFHAIVADGCGNTASFQTTFIKAISPPAIASIARDDTQPKKPRFTVTCNALNGVHHVELRENGVVLQSDTTAPYEFVIDTTSRTDGTYTLLFQCMDNQGTSSTPETRTVIADNTGPTFNFSVYGAGRSYLVSAGTVSDPRGVQSVALFGGLIPGFSVTLTQAPYQYLWNIGGTATIQSDLPFGVTARDAWGNESTLSRACYVDTVNMTPATLYCH